MQKLVQFVSRFGRDENGLTTVEYAVIIALIVIVCIAGLAALGQTSADIFTSAGDVGSAAQ